MTTRSTTLLLFISLIQLFSIPHTCFAWTPGNFLILQVGTSGVPLTSNHADLTLVEINPWASSTPVSTRIVSGGIRLSGTDYTQGTLTRSADMSTVYFAGMAAPSGSTISTSRPYNAFGRALVFVDTSGVTSYITIANTGYDGVITAVCGKDANGAWFVGNSSTMAVGYMNRNTLTYWTQMTISTSGSSYTGCGISKTGTLYFLKSESAYPYIVKVIPPAAESSLMSISSTTLLSSSPYSSKQIISNELETQFWACIVTRISSSDSGIFSGTTLSTMTQILSSPGSYRVTGIALSPGEQLLYFTTTTTLYWVFASCTSSCTPTSNAFASTNTEFRGLAPVPIPVSACSAYSNNCASCAAQSACNFCGESSTRGLCSTEAMCSSSFFATVSSECTSTAPSSTSTPTPSVPSSSSTPTPSLTSASSVAPSTNKKSYSINFYSDSACVNSIGFVTQIDNICSSGIVGGFTRGIIGILNSAGTAVSWIMYPYSVCSGTTVSSVISTPLGICTSAVDSGDWLSPVGNFFYYKISDLRVLSSYKLTFYADSSCYYTPTGSVTMTDTVCSQGNFLTSTRYAYGKLNAAGTQVDWYLYSSSGCTGLSEDSASAMSIGVCYVSTETFTGLNYYLKITLIGFIQPSGTPTPTPSNTITPTSSPTPSMTRSPTPSFTPRGISSYTTTFYNDKACSYSVGSVILTDRICTGGSIAGFYRYIQAFLNAEGTAVSWTMYLSYCGGSIVASSTSSSIGVCSSAIATDGLTYYFKISPIGSLQPSASQTPSPSISPRAITTFITTFFSDSSCSSSAGTITARDRTCTTGIIGGFSRSVRGTLNTAGTAISWILYSDNICWGSIVANSSSSSLNVCSNVIASDGLVYYFKIALSSVLQPSASSSPKAVTGYSVSFFSNKFCSSINYDGGISLLDGYCRSGSIGGYPRGARANLNKDGTSVTWKVFTNRDCSGDVTASGTDSKLDVCTSTVAADGLTYYFLISLTSNLEPSATSSNLPAPSIPPISASDTVIVKGSLRFDGLNWQTVVSAGKVEAVRKALTSELAVAAKVSIDLVTILSIQSVTVRLLTLTTIRKLAGIATEVEYSIKSTSSSKDIVSTLSTSLSSSSSLSGSLDSLKNAVAVAAGVSPSSITVSQPRPFIVEVQPSTSSSTTSSMSLTIIIAAAAGGGGVLLIIGIVAFFLCKTKPLVEKQNPLPTDTISGINPLMTTLANRGSVSTVSTVTTTTTTTTATPSVTDPVIVVHRKGIKKDEDNDENETVKATVEEEPGDKPEE